MQKRSKEYLESADDFLRLAQEQIREAADCETIRINKIDLLKLEGAIGEHRVAIFNLKGRSPIRV